MFLLLAVSLPFLIIAFDGLWFIRKKPNLLELSLKEESLDSQGGGGGGRQGLSSRESTRCISLCLLRGHFYDS